jgi:hypothetical protein
LHYVLLVLVILVFGGPFEKAIDRPINGGKLVELHRDWAVIELPVNRSQRIFYRRDLAAGKVTLPWIEHNDRSIP